MPPERPATSETEAATPADILTPHDDTAIPPVGEPAAEPAPGMIDPRHLPGPEVLAPPPPGLPVPSDQP